MAISNSASPEIIWGPGGPEEDHQLHHSCWTGRVGEEEEEDTFFIKIINHIYYHQLRTANILIILKFIYT